MRSGTASSQKERALSEVIGFVLILGIITAAFSLYLVYGVPAQGRDNEINHMNDIKDQFVSYKIGVDSLWINNQTGTTISTSFPLGTAGQTEQGSTSIIPILQPVGSSGTLAINQSTRCATFTISSNSYIINASPLLSSATVPAGPSFSQPYPNPLSGLLVTITTPSPLNSTRSIVINGSTWNATIFISPQMSPYTPSARSTCPSGSTAALTINASSNSYYCGTTYITLTVQKNGVTTLDNCTIFSNVAPQTVYNISLLDPAYGLNNVITYPATITYTNLNTANAYATAQYAYQQQSYTYSVPLGSLAYNANNNYWIPQTYYYQMGGVFLSQSNGITYKLPPDITFVNNGNGNITVNIVALAYDGSNSGIIGGNSPAQISTSLKPDAGSLPYAPVSPNTWNASINITTSDLNAAIMWAVYLNAAANQTGGIPTTYYTAGDTTTGSFIVFNGSWINDSNPHITLNAKTANLSISVHGVGGTSL